MSHVTCRKSQIPHRCAEFSRAAMHILLLLAFCIGAGQIASAQQDVGYILGTVTDQTGAALSGASVTITWQIDQKTSRLIFVFWVRADGKVIEVLGAPGSLAGKR